MGKRLKLRLWRILSNCRSKDSLPSSDPSPTPLSFSLPASSSSFPRPHQTFRWKQEKDFHVVSISTLRDRQRSLDGDASKAYSRPSVSRRPRRCRAIVHQGRKHGRVPLSDEGLEADDRDGTGYLMSSEVENAEEEEEEEEEEEGFLLTKRRVSEVEVEARLSSMERRWWPCSGDDPTGMITTTKVRESYAVVKRTEDPHGEFQRSMMEMVMEKEIYEEEGLRELLWCLLLLNTREHHGTILRAFAEVYEALFRKKKEKKKKNVLDGYYYS